jgi:hypothetical protein
LNDHNDLKINFKSAANNAIDFKEFLVMFDRFFTIIPTSFSNNGLVNKIAENEGSLKVFASAKYCNATDEEALSWFKEHYQSVLDDPDGDSHQNIRHFQKGGLENISFDINIIPIKLG